MNNEMENGMKATKINTGTYIYRGWLVEKMESGQWNMKPEDDDYWTDAANTLRDAKEDIDRYTAT